MDPSVSELRRQRDAIRHEMEQLVRTMQRLEPDVEQKRSGWEQKREELVQHRSKLSELRAKMRAVMDATSAPANLKAAVAPSLQPPLQNSNSPVTSGGGRQLFTSPGQAGTPGGSYTSTSHARNVSPKRQSNASSSSPPTIHPRPTAHFPGTQQLAELAAVQKAEKQRLTEEFHQAMEALERRHAHEVSELESRLQQEESHLREYEIARQRMEDAQRHLDALKRTPSVLNTRPAHPPELEVFLRR